MTRAGCAALAMACAVALGPQPAGAVHRLFGNSVFCDQRQDNKGTAAVADGPSSQIGVHTDVFAPAFAAACPSGSGLVTYLGTGEQAGINAVVDHWAERRFGTADVPFSTLERVQATFDLRAPDRRNRSSLVHQVPLFLDVQAIGYNLSACPVPKLNLRSQVLSLIYSGRINYWNHDLIVLDNPGLKTCVLPIRVIKRAEFSGSTATFKDYLSKRNPQWNYYKQPPQNQLWPSFTNACPALGEEGMADCIISTRNSIGYIQYRMAKLRAIKTAHVDSATSALSTDPSKRFIAPSAAACTQAAASSILLPPIDPVPLVFTETPGISPTIGDWSTVSLTDAPAGYPICSFGYAFIFNNIQPAYAGQSYPFGAARTSVDYLWTAVSDAAQAKLAGSDYGRLPPNVLAASRAGLEEIRFQG